MVNDGKQTGAHGLFSSVAGEALPESQQWSEAAWIDVVRKMDEVYADLIRHEIDLENNNQALAEAQQFISSVITSMSDVMIVCDARGHVVQVNRALIDLARRPESELLQQSLAELFVPEHREFVRQNLQLIRLHPIHDCELSLQGIDGAVPLTVNCTGRSDRGGKFDGIVLIGRPIGELRKAYAALKTAHSELQRTQQQLIHSEKLASLGRLIAGVAHELNNPIGFVYGNVHSLRDYGRRVRAYIDASSRGAPAAELALLSRELRLDKVMNDLDPLLDGTMEGIERMRHIVQDLHRYSSSHKGKREQVLLARVMGSAVRWAMRGQLRTIEVRNQVPDEIVIMGFEGHLHQVFVNLVQNALDATTQVTLPKIEIAAHVSNDMAVITVQDNGHGIAEADLPNIFDPFFTTKPVGKGMGLGLSITEAIVRDHGGTISAGNVPGGGAVFTIRLPGGSSSLTATS